jgi:hypothetical protein
MQSTRAQKVVEHFKEVLSPSGRKAVTESHFEELALMIESAIEAAVLEESGAYASRLEQLIAEMRRSSSTFDELSALPEQQTAG